MKTVYVLFKYKGKNICGRWVKGSNDEEIISNASWHLICHYPNVRFDEVILNNNII